MATRSLSNSTTIMIEIVSHFSTPSSRACSVRRKQPKDSWMNSSSPNSPGVLPIEISTWAWNNICNHNHTPSTTITQQLAFPNLPRTPIYNIEMVMNSSTAGEASKIYWCSVGADKSKMTVFLSKHIGLSPDPVWKKIIKVKRCYHRRLNF